MDRIDFINQIKDDAMQIYKEYKIIPSLTIAQGILESKSGESDLSIQGNNLFGIKWSENCGCDKISMPTKEFINGQWITINAYFRKYNNWSESIRDHAIFLLKERYKNLIGDINYKSVCQKIYEDGYATDPNYPLKLINLVEQYNLNQYDNLQQINNINNQGGNNMVISYDFGHMKGSQDGGASGYLDEYTVVRQYGQVCVDVLKKAGHTLINCTPSDGSCSTVGQSLSYRASISNKSGACFHLCFHANCFDSESAHGAEVEYASSKGSEFAQSVLNEICKLGFTSRGIKNPNLYMTKNTSAVSILIEPFFVSNKSDCDKYNAISLGNAIAKGILNILGGNYIPSTNSSTQSSTNRLIMLTSPLMYGQDVKDVQTKLNKLGYKVDIDGWYGNASYNAICNLQKKLGLSVDGIVGNGTLSAINSEIAKLNQSKTSPTSPQSSQIDHSIPDNPYVVWKSPNGLGYIESVPEKGRLIIHLDKYNHLNIQDDEKEGNHVWVQTRTKGSKTII